MDPDAALDTLRTLCHQEFKHGDWSQAEANNRLYAMAEQFQALDEWLSGNGFRPRAWAFAPFPPARDANAPMSAPGAPAHVRTGGTPTPVSAPGVPPNERCRRHGHVWLNAGRSHQVCERCPVERHFTEDGHSYMVDLTRAPARTDHTPH